MRGGCFYSIFYLFDRSAAQDHFSVVQYGGLAGGDGPLGFIELDVNVSFPVGVTVAGWAS